MRASADGEKENNSSDTDSDTEEYLSNVHRYLPLKIIWFMKTQTQRLYTNYCNLGIIAIHKQEVSNKYLNWQNVIEDRLFINKSKKALDNWFV